MKTHRTQGQGPGKTQSGGKSSPYEQAKSQASNAIRGIPKVKMSSLVEALSHIKPQIKVELKTLKPNEQAGFVNSVSSGLLQKGFIEVDKSVVVDFFGFDKSILSETVKVTEQSVFTLPLAPNAGQVQVQMGQINAALNNLGLRDFNPKTDLIVENGNDISGVELVKDSPYTIVLLSSTYPMDSSRSPPEVWGTDINFEDKSEVYYKFANNKSGDGFTTKMRCFAFLKSNTPVTENTSGIKIFKDFVGFLERDYGDRLIIYNGGSWSKELKDRKPYTIFSSRGFVEDSDAVYELGRAFNRWRFKSKFGDDHIISGNFMGISYLISVDRPQKTVYVKNAGEHILFEKDNEDSFAQIVQDKLEIGKDYLFVRGNYLGVGKLAYIYKPNRTVYNNPKTILLFTEEGLAFQVNSLSVIPVSRHDERGDIEVLSDKFPPYMIDFINIEMLAKRHSMFL